MRKYCIAVLLLAGTSGCPPRSSAPLAPIPMGQAIGLVNANSARITTCIKAEGSASGALTDDSGRRHRFDLPHSSFQVIPPRHLYLTCKSGLLTEEILLGSNDRKYWIHVRQDGDTYRHGTHAALEGEPGLSMPLRPDQLIEALGLNALPQDSTGRSGPMQRIVDEYQQIIFPAETPDGQGWIHKEYWLDRYEPRLVRRIVFRDVLGRVVMESRLSRYKPMGGDGPLLPHRVHIEWPQQNGVLDFAIRRWKPMPTRTADHAAFIAPHDRGLSYTYMIDLDMAGEVDRGKVHVDEWSKGGQ